MALLAGTHTSISQLLVEFLRVSGGGLAVGGIIGLLVAQALRRIDDAMVAITLTMVAAYGSFLFADQMDFSGVISTVAAGLICGNYGLGHGMSPSRRVAANTFWEYLGFALNSLVFLLMGFEIRLDALWAVWPLILLAYLAMTLARALVVAVTSGALAWTSARIPHSWALVLSWGGLRGALSMVLVLSLPTCPCARHLSTWCSVLSCYQFLYRV
ncbi:cation:proton antiporter [Thiogranum longum]|uniref:cation:proton antiporter domain-containing protein n=1 Tax=Thiogranum longum TaxID=1537524 RepID=UPI001A9D49D8|nr:cation:proton antiporter [Thiogranum longum]